VSLDSLTSSTARSLRTRLRTCTTASTTKEPSSPGSTMSSARLSIPLAGSGETRRARLPKDCAKGTNIFFGGGYGVGVETTRRLCLGPFTFRLARDDLYVLSPFTHHTTTIQISYLATVYSATSRRLPDAPVRQFRFRPQRLKGEQPFMWDTSRLVSVRLSILPFCSLCPRTPADMCGVISLLIGYVLSQERRSSGRNPCGKIMGSLLSLEGVVCVFSLISSFATLNLSQNAVGYRSCDAKLLSTGGPDKQLQRLLIPSQVHPITSLAITILFPVHFPLQSSRG
jgi:hypothetical protein